MTLEHDFDPDLARQLEVRLAAYAPVDRIPPRLARRSSRRRLIVVVALAATLAAGAVDLGYEINAAAESAGLGCLHPIAKVQLYVSGIGAGHDGDHGADRQGHDERASHEACHP
jgi:hypothetical protein